MIAAAGFGPMAFGFVALVVGLLGMFGGRK